jgi:hypothetical protein
VVDATRYLPHFLHHLIQTRRLPKKPNLNFQLHVFSRLSPHTRGCLDVSPSACSRQAAIRSQDMWSHCNPVRSFRFSPSYRSSCDLGRFPCNCYRCKQDVETYLSSCRVGPTVIQWSDFSPERKSMSSDTFTSYCKQCWELEKEREDASRPRKGKRAGASFQKKGKIATTNPRKEGKIRKVQDVVITISQVYVAAGFHLLHR